MTFVLPAIHNTHDHHATLGPVDNPRHIATLNAPVFSSPTFKNTGTFLLGSSITGPATWDGCGVVDCQDNGVDIDGSTFRNPNGNHLLSIPI